MPSQPACIAVLIHGLGNQAPDWSQDFRTALNQELGAVADRVRLVDAYWAPLSTLEDALHPTEVAGPPGVSESALGDEAYRRAALEFSRMLAAEAGAPVGAESFGPSDLFGTIEGLLPGGRELAVDVGNYVGRNGVRTAVQNVLHACLGAASAEGPGVPTLVVSHSQGTVISYDVLRQAGGSYANLRTWITMGCPLRKYFAFPFEWGRRQLGVPLGLRWLNLFDPMDIVGKDLSGAVDWPAPQPQDQMVDNVNNAHGAHDHWHNPQVVQAVAAEITGLLG